jgi:hypothetical protein
MTEGIMAANQSTELRTKLTKEIKEVSWDALIPHAERDALILVDHTLELVEVAIVAAEDCADLMNLWVEKGWLTKPSQNDLADFEENPSQQFDFLIVQPYVFARTKAA